MNIHIFEEADEDWLHFVAGNRRDVAMDNDDYREFDIIGGKIANDRTARTLQIYISGGYGEIGSPTADRIAISTLLPNNLDDQFCFSTKRVNLLNVDKEPEVVDCRYIDVIYILDFDFNY